MSFDRPRRLWLELLLALVVFGGVVGLVEATGASRELVLPTWVSFVVALELAVWRSRKNREACRARLSRGARP